MPEYAQDPRLSTFFDGNAAITKFQPLVAVTLPGGDVEYHVDMLHHRTLAAVRRLPVVGVHQYQGTEHITTIAFQKFGTTSLWWLLMIYNGAIHPLEILPGTLLRIPDHNVFLERLGETGVKIIRSGGAAGARTVTI